MILFIEYNICNSLKEHSLQNDRANRQQLTTKPESEVPRWRIGIFQDQSNNPTQKTYGCILPKTKCTFFMIFLANNRERSIPFRRGKTS